MTWAAFGTAKALKQRYNCRISGVTTALPPSCGSGCNNNSSSISGSIAILTSRGDCHEAVDLAPEALSCRKSNLIPSTPHGTCVPCRFPGDDVPVVRGSALCALKGEKQDIGKDAILKLMQVGCWEQVGSWRAGHASTLPAMLAVQRQTNTHTARMHADACNWALGCGQCILICDNGRVSFELFVLRVDIRVAGPTP
jgi:hypothetical protein